MQSVDAANFQSQSREDVEEPPNGGYGWVCVAACWIFNAFTWGGVSVRIVQNVHNM